VLQELEVQIAERNGGLREVAPVHRLDAEVVRQERQQVLFRDEAEIEEESLQPLAALLLQPLHLAQVVRTDPALLEEELLEGAVLELHEPSRIPARLLSGKP
jgi:hypothetical protein